MQGELLLQNDEVLLLCVTSAVLLPCAASIMSVSVGHVTATDLPFVSILEVIVASCYPCFTEHSLSCSHWPGFCGRVTHAKGQAHDEIIVSLMKGVL